MEWLCRRPGLLIVAVTTTAALAAVPLVAFPVPILMAAGLIFACWGGVTLHRKRHVTHQELGWRADYETWLAAQGHPTGTYGRYPPAI